VVFHSLKREELDEVLEIELKQVQKGVLDSTTRPFLFRITNEGQFFLEEGTDQRYGARHLKRALSVISCTQLPDCWRLCKCIRVMQWLSITILAKSGLFS